MWTCSFCALPYLYIVIYIIYAICRQYVISPNNVIYIYAHLFVCVAIFKYPNDSFISQSKCLYLEITAFFAFTVRTHTNTFIHKYIKVSTFDIYVLYKTLVHIMHTLIFVMHLYLCGAPFYGFQNCVHTAAEWGTFNRIIEQIIVR